MIDQDMSFLIEPQFTSVRDAMDYVKKKVQQEAQTSSSAQIDVQSNPTTTPPTAGASNTTMQSGTQASQNLNQAQRVVSSAPSSPTKRTKKPKKEKTYKRTNRNKWVDNEAITRVKMARLQQLEYTYDAWKECGLESYLLMTHAHDNQVYGHTPKSIMRNEYVPQTTIHANTERFGVTTDKGFIGYQTDFYKGFDREHIKALLGFDERSYEAILGTLDANTPHVSENTLQSVVDACYTNEYFINRSMIPRKPSNTIPISVQEFANASPILGEQPAAVGAIDLRRIQAEEGMINLYIIDDVIFTTTAMLKAGMIDPYQRDNNFYLPCTGIIQDLLTTFLLSSADYSGTYYICGDLIPYTSAIKNICYKPDLGLTDYVLYNKVDATGTSVTDEDFTIADVNTCTLYASYFPFAKVQRGGGMYLTNINIVTLNKEKIKQYVTSGKDMSHFRQLLPIGDIYPIARLVKIEGDVRGSVLPLSLEETSLYPINLLYLKQSLELTEDTAKTYTLDDLKTLDKFTMYSQAVLDATHYISEVAKMLDVPVVDKKQIEHTDTTSSDQVAVRNTKELLDKSGYVCPTILTTTKQFAI